MQQYSQKDVILQTKILPPQVKKNTLVRYRLIKLLKENLDKKLILVNAGAGYGKTTLISQMLAKTKTPFVYYSLDKADSELAVFFAYLIAGVKNVYHTFGKRTENILSTIKPPDKYWEIIVGTFINEVVEKVSENLIVILDDYHNIKHSRYVAQTLDYLFKRSPPSIHFIVLSRQMPNFLITQLKAKNDYFELTGHDLKFTGEEIARLFKDINSIPLADNDIKTIEKHSEGWVTSLQLLLQSSMGNVKRIIKSYDVISNVKEYPEWQQDYFNYFAQEIYDHEPKDIQQFMACCSITELLNREICSALTKKRTSGRILRDLESRNIFLFRLPDNNYRFHPLFRDFLFSKLIDLRQKKKICANAAYYYRKMKQYENAISYYFETGDHKKVVTIIKKIGYDLVNKGKSVTLCSYIDGLPVSLVNADPDILRVYGYALIFRGYPSEATANFIKAVKILRKQKKSSTKLADTYYHLGSISYNIGKYKSAKKWLVKALDIYPKKKDLTRAGILNSLGILYSKMGYKRFAEAIDCFSKAHQIVRNIPKSGGLEASIINNWAMVERKAGNLNTAYEKFVIAMELLGNEENYTPQCGIIFNNAARHCLYTGRTQQALLVLKSGTKMSEKYNDLSSLAAVCFGYARYYEELADYQKAKTYLEKAKNMVNKLGIKRMALPVNQDLCRVNTTLGFLTEAEQYLSAVYEIQKSMGNPDLVSTRLTEAKLRIAQEKFDRAEQILQEALKMTRMQRHPYELFTILIEQAKLMNQKATLDDMTEVLKQALMCSKEKGYDYQLSREIQKERWMLNALLKIDRKYALSIFKQGSLPYHFIEIFLFGNPKVRMDGKWIDPEVWKTSKALKLFCYLCVSKEKTLSREILIDAIWKDTPLTKSSKSFRKAMHHIRMAFKSVTKTVDNPVIFKDGLYHISQNLYTWIDTDEFVSLLNHASKVKGNYHEMKTVMEKTSKLYQDGFAKAWYDDWASEMRIHYDKMYEERLSIAVEQAIKKNNCKDSIIWLEKLLSIDYYEEEYHRKLWRVYARLKKYKNIKQDFRFLKQCFKKELKIDLQQETTALYESLIQ